MIFNFLIALIGSLSAGLIDLKTTEIPDEIPLLMGSLGVFNWFVYSLEIVSFQPLFYSLISGFVLLAIGWIIYISGQWGGGDATLLGAIGFLFPSYSLLGLNGLLPIQLTFFVNLMLVGCVYMVVYSLILGFRNKKLFKTALLNFKEKSLLNLIIVILILILSRYIPFEATVILFLLFLFYYYGKAVEEVGFKKTIPVSELKEGDVLADSKRWDGLTKKQIEKIKKQRKNVTIKDGVRFGLSFFFTVIVTYYYGNLLVLLM